MQHFHLILRQCIQLMCHFSKHLCPINPWIAGLFVIRNPRQPGIFCQKYSIVKRAPANNTCLISMQQDLLSVCSQRNQTGLPDFCIPKTHPPQPCKGSEQTPDFAAKVKKVSNIIHNDKGQFSKKQSNYNSCQENKKILLPFSIKHVKSIHFHSLFYHLISKSTL